MIIDSLKNDKAFRLNFTTIVSFVINVIYAVGNLLLGLYDRSFWLITMGAYFMVLSLMRFGCLRALRSEKRFTGRFVGILLICLCVTLVGSVILSDRMDVAKPMHEIVMLAVSTYTTVKTTLAIINIVKVKKIQNPVWTALRNISCADAAASILTMQRSMLVSFGETDVNTIKLLNLFTGIGVCLVVFALGVAMISKANNKS